MARARRERCTVRGCTTYAFTGGLCRSHALARCDAAFSRRVRAGGFCERCGKTKNLQCAHGFSRVYRATRWTRANAWCLCCGCHYYFTKTARFIEWDDWMRDHLGVIAYWKLRNLALGGDADRALVDAVGWLITEGAEGCATTRS